MYPESSLTWIRNVTFSEPRKDAKRVNQGKLERSREKGYDGDDDAPLYIKEGSKWEPRAGTIVDLSTRLVIEPWEGYQYLLCRSVGKLSPLSLERLDSIMDQLRNLPMDQYDQVMTTPTPRWRAFQMPGYVTSANRAQFQRATYAEVNPTATGIFRPNDVESTLH